MRCLQCGQQSAGSQADAGRLESGRFVCELWYARVALERASTPRPALHLFFMCPICHLVHNRKVHDCIAGATWQDAVSASSVLHALKVLQSSGTGCCAQHCHLSPTTCVPCCDRYAPRFEAPMFHFHRLLHTALTTAPPGSQAQCQLKRQASTGAEVDSAAGTIQTGKSKPSPTRLIVPVSCAPCQQVDQQPVASDMSHRRSCT